MTEDMPPTPEQLRRLNRDLMEKILDRAAIDPEWKQLLLNDPEAAIQEAGFPEAERLLEMQASVEALQEAEVAGQVITAGDQCMGQFNQMYNCFRKNHVHTQP